WFSTGRYTVAVETFALRATSFMVAATTCFLGFTWFLLAEWRWHFPWALTAASFLSDSRGSELQNFHEKRDAC
ncbi:hypothetical protein PXY50_21985, partial [Acinetobacter baumannii]|nr:hypothetical protein [Acinetobacter baumannii]